MIKLWLNYDKIIVMIKYGEIMEVGEGRNFGIPQDSMMHIWVFCGLPGCCFFFNRCLYYDTFFEVLKSLKGKKRAPKCSKYKDRYL